MRPFVWEKLGRVFAPGPQWGRPWLATFAQAPSALVLADRVRMYFSCRPLPDANGQFVSYSAYVDLDRGDPTRVLGLADSPILQLGQTGCFDEFGTYPVTVLARGKEVIAYYGGWTRCASVPFDVAIGRAVSRDGGRSFERMGPGPVLSACADEPFVIGGPKIRFFDGRCHLFYIAGQQWILHRGRPEPVYKIRAAVSEDGVYWQRMGRSLIADVLPYEAQASPDVFEHDGRYHMFFCYRHGTDYRNGTRGYRIGYASSDDLVTWRRDDALAGLDVSPGGWDSEMVCYPHVFAVDDRVYLAYIGNGVGRDGFGLARLAQWGGVA